MILVCMERESDMSVKYIVNENFKSTEQDRKICFLKKLAKLIDAAVKDPSDNKERWQRA